MKLLKTLALGLALLALVSSNAKAVVIHEDMGGQITKFVDKYVDMDRSGEQVVIDGPCASACTIAVKVHNVCITPNAVLGFHSAFIYGSDGEHLYEPLGTALMWSMYPEAVRKLIRARGWNGHSPHPDVIWIGAKALKGAIKECS